MDEVAVALRGLDHEVARPPRVEEVEPAVAAVEVDVHPVGDLLDRGVDALVDQQRDLRRATGGHGSDHAPGRAADLGSASSDNRGADSTPKAHVTVSSSGVCRRVPRSSLGPPWHFRFRTAWRRVARWNTDSLGILSDDSGDGAIPTSIPHRCGTVGGLAMLRMALLYKTPTAAELRQVSGRLSGTRCTSWARAPSRCC